MVMKLGARWDDPVQDDRIGTARDAGLIDYIEVNYPIPYNADPGVLGLPILAHTSSNPTCSALGINAAVAKRVKDGADRADSPWIGEHLSWLGSSSSGSLGYQINPLFTPEFEAVTVDNVRRLRDFYGRPVALELGPIYLPATGCDSEMHFLGHVAERADTAVILDVAHWQITNRNLDRPPDYGLDAIAPARIVELHVAGMRCGSDSRFWHDAHDLPPSEEVLEITAGLVADLPALEAVTFEHNPRRSRRRFPALPRAHKRRDGKRPRGMTALAIDAGQRQRARKLQVLHVRLLFCEETRVAWRNAPGDVLAAFGLPQDAMSLLAVPDSDQFRTEVRGRRMGVRKSVARCFPGTQKYLASLRDAPRGRPPPPGFDAFLCSDAFLEPDYGLPHSSGVGMGYENVSKYFFWLRAVARLKYPDTNIELRNTAYAEFAAWLINEYRRPHEPYFDRFKGGLYWCRVPGQGLPVMLLSDAYVLFTLTDPETVRRLPEIGLIDLDDLAPPVPAQAPTLI